MPSNTLQTLTGTISWATATAWSLAAVPVSSDDVYVQNASTAITSGFNQQAAGSAVTLSNLYVPLSFTGSIGDEAQAVKSITGITRASTTATVTTSTAHGYSNGTVVEISGADQADYNIIATISNASGSTFDYTVANSPTTPATTSTAFRVRKSDFLNIGATNVRIGQASNSGTGNGSGRLKFNWGSVANTTIVEGTASSATDTGLEPVQLRGTSTSNSLTVISGRVGYGTTRPGDACNLASASVLGAGAVLNLGTNLTWASSSNLRITAGTANLNTAGANLTVTQTGGTVNARGDYLLEAASISNGTFNAYHRRSAGGNEVTTLTLYDGAILDASFSPDDFAIGTIVLNGNATIRRNKARPGHLTWGTLTQNRGKLTLD